MKHLNKGRTLGRKQGPKKALMKNLAKSLFLHEKIETTLAKAKEIRPFAEKLISRSRNNDLHSYRILMRTLADNLVVDKLVKEIGPKYKTRNGGYTRIVKTGPRPGDNAQMAIIELV
ncbi:MAG TPA: 50S ribosomal protein L17 [Patescibacteria group bacterium]|nr:50S ribosomal protein L17 [Patescibacteria group bacterium]